MIKASASRAGGSEIAPRFQRSGHPRRRNVTTSVVGLRNGHICNNFTKNGEPQRSSWGTQKKNGRAASLASWSRRPPRERKIPGSNPVCDGIFPGWSHTSDLKIGTPVLLCQDPGVTGSVLGLVGPVSVYCDWVRWKVWSATSISVWHHVNLPGPSRRYTSMLLGRLATN